MSEIGQRQLKLTEKESEKDEKMVEEEEDHIWGHVKEQCDWMPKEEGRQNIVTFSFFSYVFIWMVMDMKPYRKRRNFHQNQCCDDLQEAFF